MAVLEGTPLYRFISSTNTCAELSDSTVGPGSPKLSVEDGHGPALWMEGKNLKNAISVSGIPKYSYKDVQKATDNFTALIAKGAFGPVYKAQMCTGEIVAVKVLANDSKQGEKEFHNEEDSSDEDESKDEEPTKIPKSKDVKMVDAQQTVTKSKKKEAWFLDLYGGTSRQEETISWCSSVH